MIVLKIVAVFAAIMVTFHFKKPLWLAMLVGTATTLLVFWQNPAIMVGVFKTTCQSYATWQMILAMLLITFLQHILERRQQLQNAVVAMNGLFSDKRVNAEVASACLGMLPGAGVVNMAGKIISDTAGDALTNEEKATCASYFRHIPESFVPTFTAVLLGCNLSGIPIANYVLAFIPMAIMLFVLGHLFFMRKIPKGEKTVQEGKKSTYAWNLLKSLWTILLIVLLVMVLKIDIVPAVLIIDIIAIFAFKVTPAEIAEFAKKSFDIGLLLGLFLIYIFKDTLAAAGILEVLPAMFNKLPLPVWLTFALLFFVGTIVAGSRAVIASFMPMAFVAVGGVNLPLFVLLMGSAYAAMQISPTHVCVPIAAAYFHVSVGDMFRKTAPMVLCFFGVLILYYLLLSMFL